jgi:predicted O-methyltransferase YrrM
MNALLDEIYRTGVVVDADGEKIVPFPSSIRQGMGEAFYELVSQRNLTRTLEVGLAYGLASMFLCQAHHDRGEGSHIAIDPGQENYRSVGLLNMRRAGLDERFRFEAAPSYEALPRLLAEGQKLDFAFIDGLHVFDYALVDFFYVDRMLEVGGLVAFDDLWMPAVRKVISFALRNRHYERIRVDTTAGLPPAIRLGRLARILTQRPHGWHEWKMRFTTQGALVLRKLDDDDRAWDWHRSF